MASSYSSGARFMSSLLAALVGLAACRPMPEAPTSPGASFVSETVELDGVANDPPQRFELLPGDVVQVKTISVEPMDVPGLTVDAEGRVDLPLAGAVAIGGKTPSEAAVAIEKALARYDRHARVALTVTQAAGHVATITGAVEKPGAIVLRPDMRLAEILAVAGGPRQTTAEGELVELADLDAARVVRDGVALPVSLGAALRGQTQHNVRLRPGDVIFVPSSGGKIVTVLGEVAQPKTIAWRKGMRLTTALGLTGGIARSGDGSDVRIVRGKLSEPQVYRASLNALVRGEGGDIELAPGDVVYVGADWFWTTTEVLNRLMPALAMASLTAGLAR